MQGPKEPLGRQETRVLRGSRACQECRELMVHRVTPERRDLPERKDTWAPLALKGPLVTLDPEA